MTGAGDTEVPESRRRAARLVLVVVAVLMLAYPALFFGWYLTAEHVTVRVTACPSDAPNPLRCPTYGEWRLADGSTGSGRVFAQSTTPSDVGHTLPARATSSWAVAEGVTASAPGTYAAIVAVLDVVLAAVVLVLRSLYPPRR